MKQLLDKLRTVPHLFAKCMVLWCVACGTAFSYYALRILSRTGHDSSALLGVILAGAWPAGRRSPTTPCASSPAPATTPPPCWGSSWPSSAGSCC